jgi:hypothetical protein
MGAFKGFKGIAYGLLSCSCAVMLGAWQEVCYQPVGELVMVYNVNWKPMIKTANDRVFDLKVEAGVVPAPAI